MKEEWKKGREGKGKVTWAAPLLQTTASSLGKHQLSVELQGAANSLPALS